MVGIVLTDTDNLAPWNDRRQELYIGEINLGLGGDNSSEERIALENQDLILLVDDSKVRIGADAD